MTDWDKQYIKLCEEILNKGIEVDNRTGINTIKIPSYNLKFDLKKEYPILTTKQLYSRQAIVEMLWIWQMSSNDVRELQNRNVHIWDEWMVDEDGIYRIYEPYGEYDPDKEVDVIDPFSVPITDPFGKTHQFEKSVDENGNVRKAKSLIPGKTIKMAKYYGKEYAYTIGTAYGYITGKYGFAKNLIDTIKNDPNDRRMVKSLWQDEYLRGAVLPSCVWSTEWDVSDGYLNLCVHQRSCDVPLGLPFNITQYATLLCMIAKSCNLKPGIYTHSIKDAHIYVNQVDGIKEQIRRFYRFKELKKMTKKELREMLPNATETDVKIIDMIINPSKPELFLNPEVNDFFDYDNSKDIKDVKILNYKSMGKIDFPLAQ